MCSTFVVVRLDLVVSQGAKGQTDLAKPSGI